MDFSVPVPRVSAASGDTDENWTLKTYSDGAEIAAGVPRRFGNIAIATAVADSPESTGWITHAVHRTGTGESLHGSTPRTRAA